MGQKLNLVVKMISTFDLKKIYILNLQKTRFFPKFENSNIQHPYLGVAPRR